MNIENKEKIMKVLKIVAIIVLVVSIIGASVYLKTKLTPNNENNITETVTKKETISSEYDGVNLQEEALALNLEYKDVVGWLKIDGTSIDRPVFQAPDHDRYLRHDRDHEYTKWGELFLDFRNDIDKIEDEWKHYIIYGHNTEEDTFFTPMYEYKEEEFFKENKYIQMSTLKGNYTWEIFSVYITDINFFYIKTVFNNVEEYSNFLESVKVKSMYDTQVTVDSNDTILTLSTCDYSIKDGRFVIHAKLIKE